MDKFLTEEGLNLISMLLVMGVAGYVFLGWLWHRMEEDDAQWLAANELDTEPLPFDAPGFPSPLYEDYIKQILAEWELRKPLPVYRNTNSAAQAYDNERNAAELARGTSDNLLIAVTRGRHE